MPDETPMSDGGIDLSAAQEKPRSDSSNKPDDDGPFCPFSWMLGHSVNPLTKQAHPVPFANACLRERCAVYSRTDEGCGILSMSHALGSIWDKIKVTDEVQV